MRKLFVLLGISIFLIFTLTTLVFAQTSTQTEQLTITTYYPSPYGSYNELQLYPHESATTPCGPTTPETIGTLYYKTSAKSVLVCRGDSLNDWVEIGVGSVIQGSGIWTQAGNVVRLTNSANTVGIGIAVPAANTKVNVIGNVGASGYCDETGQNCFTAAQIITLIGSSGGGVRGLESGYSGNRTSMCFNYGFCQPVSGLINYWHENVTTTGFSLGRKYTIQNIPVYGYPNPGTATDLVTISFASRYANPPRIRLTEAKDSTGKMIGINWEVY